MAWILTAICVMASIVFLWIITNVSEDTEENVEQDINEMYKVGK